MVVSFKEMHRFYYEFQAILSANDCYGLTAAACPKPFLSLLSKDLFL
jgi:hypothetical protein